ncbi:thioredoxin-disulfide reductase [Campylobacter hyointestinalis]|uniref:Thioredoxin reductase n=1 Tax=Campylobacter hyointestinalis subsp. hyointestinalis TaxID=91352 RepID=A0A855N297_CAMHY|nr:thioredoxin-disulfide reductase [Campylobacter hyointestinalis]ANE31999.1 thioredoxin reductase [Campylobacter hyointestinalis subsp. hyointestinalis LMG 9260]KEA44489.1 thioredoxin reductase [Campylobacter hyointestinalis subsp. hyointestinalis]MBT0612029.1 thioredoxin-disulfide reductase [Campylobacter hyointestinalis subsp. hyointestinalis]MDL2347198.1 thioredoxin-disulfide reductase [Campylobacter hyointestinalis]MDL2348940.1 thioredoxin-disulfide reductase [Campylobacter hyointestinali
MLDVAIIGGGPAGLSAGLYATRGGLKNVVMFEKGMPGGQITSSSEMENYPGVATVMDGMSFMAPWTEQCTRFGLKHEMANVEKVAKNSDGSFSIFLEGGKEEKAKAVIVCTGSTPKRAGFKGEDEFFGKGVSTCATCDGFFYKNKEVAVLGGGDTALEEAQYLANICSKVYLIHRRDEFRAAPVTVEKAKKNPKIEFITSASVDEVYGDNIAGVKGIKVKLKDGSIRDLQVPGIFTFVGLNVRNDVLKGEDGKFICDTLPTGQVRVNLKMQTNIPGLFAAGDLREDAPKQVVCAAADGAVAALSAMSYIESLH